MMRDGTWRSVPQRRIPIWLTWCTAPTAQQVNLAFQLYDLVASLCVKRLRKVEMILHHAFAVALCYFLLRDWCEGAVG